MRKSVYGFLLMVIPYIVVGQTIQLNFENPTQLSGFSFIPSHWEIDTSVPISGNGSLHHCFDDSESNSESIVYPHKLLNLDSAFTSWNFMIKYDYNPSASNNWAFWLVNNSASDNLTSDGNALGYLLGVNFNDASDILKLIRKDNSGVTEIINTKFNWQDSIPVGSIVQIKVERTTEGNWFVYLGKENDTSLSLLATGFDSKICQSESTGIVYKYTSTCDQKLWIDNISIAGYFYDDIFPPDIDSFNVLSKNSIEIFFNESIDTTANITFVLNTSESEIKPYWITLNHVVLSSEINFSIKNHILISNISDLRGNKIPSLNIPFDYYYPKYNDVLITEILADPTPVNELPECEYIEIYNRTEKSFSLKGWQLIVGEKKIELPDKKIEPHGTYILTKLTKTPFFRAEKNIIGLPGMPALINSGDVLQLVERYGSLIYAVEYSDTWFESEYKKDGGWSLEMIDVNQPCFNSENWGESKSLEGGTPGEINSADKKREVPRQPYITNFDVPTANTIRIQFSETMDSIKLVNIHNYTFPESTDVHIMSTETTLPFFKEVILTLSKELSTKTIYELVLNNTIASCPGNPLFQENIKLGLPEKADSADLLINEIVFESDEHTPEFVEIYNHSNKIIDLKNFSLNYLDNYTDEIQSTVLGTRESYQILPKEYIVFTKDATLLKDSFSRCLEQKIIEPEKWHDLNNKGGTIALMDPNNSFLDISVYCPEMHFDLLEYTKGVSLERISFYTAGNIWSNWHSAATTCNYATPGEKNSQQIDESESTTVFNLSPEEISPDNDGKDDQLIIRYSFKKPGYIMSVRIFNQNGTEINRLVNSELCEIEGQFIWNGLDSDGNRLSMGYYIILYEAVHPDGEVIGNKQIVLLLPEKK